MELLDTRIANFKIICEDGEMFVNSNLFDDVPLFKSINSNEKPKMQELSEGYFKTCYDKYTTTLLFNLAFIKSKDSDITKYLKCQDFEDLINLYDIITFYSWSEVLHDVEKEITMRELTTEHIKVLIGANIKDNNFLSNLLIKKFHYDSSYTFEEMLYMAKLGAHEYMVSAWILEHPDNVEQIRQLFGLLVFNSREMNDFPLICMSNHILEIRHILLLYLTINPYFPTIWSVKINKENQLKINHEQSVQTCFFRVIEFKYSGKDGIVIKCRLPKFPDGRMNSFITQMNKNISVAIKESYNTYQEVIFYDKELSVFVPNIDCINIHGKVEYQKSLKPHGFITFELKMKVEKTKDEQYKLMLMSNKCSYFITDEIASSF